MEKRNTHSSSQAPLLHFLPRPSLAGFVLASMLSVVWLAMPAMAHAHALLQKSEPTANGVLSSGAHAVLLTFNSRVDAAHSSLTLIAGDRSSPLAVDTKAPANELRSETVPMQPGHYRLRWQAVAADGHISRGEIPFDVK